MANIMARGDIMCHAVDQCRASECDQGCSIWNSMNMLLEFNFNFCGGCG